MRGYVNSNPRGQGGLPQDGGHDCGGAGCVGAENGSLQCHKEAHWWSSPPDECAPPLGPALRD